MKYEKIGQVIAQINAVIGKQETKVQKKLFKFGEKLKTYQEDYVNKVEELRLDNAAADDKEVLIVNEKGEYKFTKEGLKKLKEDIKKLNESEFDFKPIEVLNPKGLEEFHFLKDWVTGVTFDEEEADEEL
jgi:3-methyladenine DNA glycosylase AlkD